MPKPIFNIEYQFSLYLQRAKLDEKTMHPLQREQIKQTFMGAFGQVLLLLRDDLAELPEEEGVEKLDSLIKQVEQYWIREVEQYKARNQ